MLSAPALLGVVTPIASGLLLTGLAAAGLLAAALLTAAGLVVVRARLSRERRGREAAARDEGERTARLEYETRLTATELLLSQAEAIAGIGSFRYDVVNDRAVWSPNTYAVLGVAPEETPARFLGFVDSFVHTEDRVKVLEAVDRALSTGCPYDVQYRLERSAGRRVVHARGTVIRGASGEALQLLGCVQDVSEQVSAAREVRRESTDLLQRLEARTAELTALRQSLSERTRLEERLELLDIALSVAENAVVITDRGGRIEWVNSAFTRMTGWSLEEAVGKNPRILKSGEHPREFYADLWATIAAGEVWKGEITNRRKDGRTLLTEMTITPVREEGAIAHYVAVSADIGPRRHLEEQLRQASKMEAIGRLAGGLAHDFNNLLTAILGYGSLALDTLPAGSKEREAIREVLRAGERGAEMTKKLLAFSRRQAVRPEVLDLNDVVRGVSNLLLRLLGEEISISFELPVTPPLVRADRGQMEQVIVNLCVNARDAMPHGGRLAIETGTQGREVTLSVSDTGVGIDDRTKAHLFEPFFTTKAAGKGTGLGLASVYGIVTQCGGRVDVESEPGKGATFRVTLPAAASEDPREEVTQEPEAE